MKKAFYIGSIVVFAVSLLGFDSAGRAQTEFDPDTTAAIQRYLDRQKSFRELYIKTLDKKINDAKQFLGSTKKKSKASKKNAGVDEQKLSEAIQGLESALADLKSGTMKVTPGLPLGRPTIGDLGALESPADEFVFSHLKWQYKVFQVVDDRNFLLIRQMVKPALPGEPDLYWISGVSTYGLVDGMVIEPIYFLQITGTKTYATASGASRTVFVLEPPRPEVLKALGIGVLDAPEKGVE